MDDDTRKTVESFNLTADAYCAKTAILAPYNEPSIMKFISMLPRNGRILDAGCGPGRDSRRFSELGYSVTGVDLAEKMVELARRLSPSCAFSVMDIRKMEFPDASFDGVWMNTSMIFVRKSDASGVIAEASRVLKDGGRMFVRVKEGEGEDMAVDRRYGDMEKYTAYYGRDELLSMLKSAGLEVLSCESESVPYQYITHPFIAVYCRK